MFSKKIWYFLAMALFFTAPACADEMLAIKLGGQMLNIEGNLAVDGGGVAGTTVDVEDELSLDDSKEFRGEVTLSLGDFRLYGAFLPLSFSGNADLTGDPIQFNGETFNSRVSSDIDLDIYDIGLAWYLINIDDLPVRIQIGPEIAVKIVDANIAMSSTTLNEEESAVVPIPTIGLQGRVAITDFLGVVGRLGFLGYNDNRFVDVDAQIEFSPIPLMGIYLGYRHLGLEIDESDIMVDTEMSGLYGGVFARF